MAVAWKALREAEAATAEAERETKAADRLDWAEDAEEARLQGTSRQVSVGKTTGRRLAAR